MTAIGTTDDGAVMISVENESLGREVLFARLPSGATFYSADSVGQPSCNGKCDRALAHALIDWANGDPIRWWK